MKNPLECRDDRNRKGIVSGRWCASVEKKGTRVGGLRFICGSVSMDDGLVSSAADLGKGGMHPTTTIVRG